MDNETDQGTRKGAAAMTRERQLRTNLDDIRRGELRTRERLRRSIVRRMDHDRRYQSLVRLIAVGLEVFVLLGLIASAALIANWLL